MPWRDVLATRTTFHVADFVRLIVVFPVFLAVFYPDKGRDFVRLLRVVVVGWFIRALRVPAMLVPVCVNDEPRCVGAAVTGDFDNVAARFKYVAP